MFLRVLLEEIFPISCVEETNNGKHYEAYQEKHDHRRTPFPIKCTLVPLVLL